MRRIVLTSLVLIPLACFKAGDDSVADEATSDSATEASTQTESGEASTSETTTETDSSSSETTTTTETGGLCGNGVVDEGEQCDGSAGGVSCTDIGYPVGTLGCDPITCLYDTSGCTGPMCGWSPDNAYYDCGFVGEDPAATYPITCPEGLVEGAPCADTGLTGQGCCDADSNNWYCAQGDIVFFLSCG